MATKRKPKSEWDKVGRPEVIDQKKLEKLEECFLYDLSDVQACYIVDINPQTLYNYQKKHPEFVGRKKALKQMVKAKAKKVITDSINNNDVDVAKWYLERKSRDEFSTRVDNHIDGEIDRKIEVIFIENQDTPEVKAITDGTEAIQST